MEGEKNLTKMGTFRRVAMAIERRFAAHGEQAWARLPMLYPPRQKSSRAESSIGSGKFIEKRVRVLDLRA